MGLFLKVRSQKRTQTGSLKGVGLHCFACFAGVLDP